MQCLSLSRAVVNAMLGLHLSLVCSLLRQGPLPHYHVDVRVYLWTFGASCFRVWWKVAPVKCQRSRSLLYVCWWSLCVVADIVWALVLCSNS